jgi:hypothetical protein
VQLPSLLIVVNSVKIKTKETKGKVLTMKNDWIIKAARTADGSANFVILEKPEARHLTARLKLG